MKFDFYLSPIILDCWNQVVSRESDICNVPKLIRRVSGIEIPQLIQAVSGYIHNHPVRFTLQILGGVTLLVSLVTVPVLGTVGFAATGPVAGSTAAAWQASIGLVEAGSLFAWCQSAAMGGAALSGIVASGVAGAGISGAATVPHE